MFAVWKKGRMVLQEEEHSRNRRQNIDPDYSLYSTEWRDLCLWLKNEVTCWNVQQIRLGYQSWCELLYHTLQRKRLETVGYTFWRKSFWWLRVSFLSKGVTFAPLIPSMLSWCIRTVAGGSCCCSYSYSLTSLSVIHRVMSLTNVWH